MLRVGIVSYAGSDYYIHICSNGSKMRFLLFEKQPHEIDGVLRYNNELNPMMLQKADVSKFEDWVVGGIQSDKKANKAFFYGEIFLLNKFMKTYEEAINYSYKSDDEGVRQESELETRVVVNQKGFELAFSDTQILGELGIWRNNMSFKIGDIEFSTLYEENKSVNSAPYKKWTWIEDLDFSNKSFRRTVISLSAKTLAQLKQEKDLSWCYNKDGSLKKDYRVLHTMEEVRQIVHEIETNRNVVITTNPNREYPVAIDCETTGLLINSLPWTDADGNKNPLKDEIGGMSLTWRLDQGVYIPFLHTKFQNVPREECLAFLKPYLQKWYLETHNGLFDGKVFLDNGIELNIKDDSMIMLFNIDPEVAKGSKGLKENTMRRYGHETLDHDDVFPSKKDVTSYYDLTEDIVQCYACADSDYTYRLCNDCRNEVPSMKSYRLDMRVMKYLIKVNYMGNKVNGDILNRLSSICDKDIVTLEETMYKFVGQIGQLTQFEKIMANLLKEGKTTQEEIERLRKELMHTDDFKNARYEFSPSKPDILVDIIYNRLNYPVVRVSKTSGKPTADKYAIKDLLREEVEDGQEGTWLKDDILSASIEYSGTDKSDTVLIKASTFNRKKYPFVLLLQKWKDLMKLKTTFFAWFLNGSCDNMYYSDFSMTNAETSRIIGRIQTLKGSMKELIVPYDDDWYLMGVDFSQIEARLMAYLAGKWDLVERLCNPRADYHVESASMLTGKEAWQITKAERGELKSVNFAVPYGMAEYSLAENLYGTPVTEDKVEKARILLAKWRKSNWEIQTLLDSHRKFAREHHTMVRFNYDTKKLEQQELRFVTNRFGRRRFFKGQQDFRYLASVDRMAGNYPIQSYAAEIFKTAFVNINRRLEKEGLADKVIITALVHDEFLMNVHRSVDKYKLYEILWDEMVQSIYLPYKDAEGNWMKNPDGSWMIDKEHPHKFFYAGISIGPEWHDIHGNDAHEAPTEFLTYMVDKIKSGEYKFKDYESGDVTEECFNEAREYMLDVFMDECYKLQPDLRPDNVKFYQIVPAFFDYFLKGRLNIYHPKTYRTPIAKDDADSIRAKLEALMCEKWRVTYLTCYDVDDETPRFVTVSEEELTGVVNPTNLDNLSLDDLALDASMIDNIGIDDVDDNVDIGDLDDIDISGMLGDLFDDDIDNFDDDDSEFGISIPIGVYKKQEADFEILATRTSVDDKRDIWELVDFKKEVKTYDANTTSRYMIRSDTVFIDISNEDLSKVSKLIEYIKSIDDEHGMYTIKLKFNNNIKETGCKANNVDRDEVFSIMGWSLFSTV